MSGKIMKLRTKPVITGKPDDRLETEFDDGRIHVPEDLERFIDEEHINKDWVVAREEALENIEYEIRMYMNDLQESFDKRYDILRFFDYDTDFDTGRIHVPEGLERFIDEDNLNQDWVATREEALESIEYEIKMYMRDLQDSFDKRYDILRFFYENK
jgi:hypothetical protein